MEDGVREEARRLYPPTDDGLLAVLRRLRAPDGCPWDREQTRRSLARCLEGECAELLDAIDNNDASNICEELGDVLMNLVFQAVIAEERGEFTYADVTRGIVEKMIRRHAHVFGDASAGTADEVRRLWARVKASEPGHAEERGSALDGVRQSLSALNRAQKLQKRAAETGFDWTEQNGVAAKLDEELGELHAALDSGDDAAADEELGDLIFTAVNLARYRGRATAEELLRAANAKFERRFRALENLAAERGTAVNTLSASELDALWNEVKRGGSRSGSAAPEQQGSEQR